MTKEEILKKVANDHSYNDWSELAFDCHPESLAAYTEEAMELYAQSKIQHLESLVKAVEELLTELSPCWRELNRPQISINTEEIRKKYFELKQSNP